jgi:Na+-transporting methylmalonyl-CoA/oxaloacetate decarboxylase gamma subunit
MTVISRGRTKATWLTGAAGLLILGVAIVMMVLAAP